MKIEINVKQELFEFDDYDDYIKNCHEKFDSLFYRSGAVKSQTISIDKEGSICENIENYSEAEYPIKVYLLED